MDFDLNNYLTRIGLSTAPAADYEGLRAVHRAQLEAIPFENLDVLTGRVLEVDPASVFAKLVGAEKVAIPFTLIEEDLPSYSFEPSWNEEKSEEERIVAVCDCGEWACQHTRCKVFTYRGTVTLSDFEYGVSDAGRSAVFRVPEERYRQVVTEMVECARDERIRRRLR